MKWKKIKTRGGRSREQQPLLKKRRYHLLIDGKKGGRPERERKQKGVRQEEKSQSLLNHFSTWSEVAQVGL